MCVFVWSRKSWTSLVVFGLEPQSADLVCSLLHLRTTAKLFVCFSAPSWWFSEEFFSQTIVLIRGRLLSTLICDVSSSGCRASSAKLSTLGNQHELEQTGISIYFFFSTMLILWQNLCQPYLLSLPSLIVFISSAVDGCCPPSVGPSLIPSSLICIS